MSKIMQKIPEIGKTYYAFDDGKISESRRYEVVIAEIIPFGEADEAIKTAWKCEVEQAPYLYAEETDYFIVSVCHETGFPIISVFVRTVDGGWFSFSDEFWYGEGLLDIDGKLNASLTSNSK